jgi:hypothetical protein
VIAILLFIVLSVVGLWWIVKQNAAYDRAKWKDSTLVRLAGLSITNEESRQELETLKPGPDFNDFGWAHDHVILMTNGEYIIYASRHGANNLFDHLFLGHGSDGQWLYSTYHFCNSMNMLRGDDPPGSIAEFAKKYSAREFNGRSDECLKHTWP